VKQIPKPPTPRQDPQLASRGGYFFDKETCVMCHGYAAENAGGVVADLRMASAETHANLSEIVVGGARRAMGMPSFPNLPPDELKAIDAFIINQAWTGYCEQRANKDDGEPSCVPLPGRGGGGNSAVATPASAPATNAQPVPATAPRH
jgi:mono/diheme cytochrome c family protein